MLPGQTIFLQNTALIFSSPVRFDLSFIENWYKKKMRVKVGYRKQLLSFVWEAHQKWYVVNL